MFVKIGAMLVKKADIIAVNLYDSDGVFEIHVSLLNGDKYAVEQHDDENDADAALDLILETLNQGN